MLIRRTRKLRSAGKLAIRGIADIRCILDVNPNGGQGSALFPASIIHLDRDDPVALGRIASVSIEALAFALTN